MAESIDSPSSSENPNAGEAKRRSGARFPTTRWSMVLASGDRAAPALSELCRIYREPLLRFLLRSGHVGEEAEDLLHDFFTALAAGRSLRPEGPDAGRFRSYLLGALKHHVGDARKRTRALKRGGAICFVPLGDVGEHDLETSLDSPERAFERRWATAILEEAMRRLADEYEQSGRAPLYDALRALLDAERGGEAYGETARRFDMSEGGLRVALHRFRKRYARWVRLVVAETVARPEEVDDEMAYLGDALSAMGRAGG